MNKKISILPIALMLIAICFLPTCVQAGPQHIVSVPSGPSEGNTMEDIDFTEAIGLDGENRLTMNGTLIMMETHFTLILSLQLKIQQRNLR